MICTCAGTRSILPDGEMSNHSGSSGESDLDSSREEIDREMTEEEAREFRRLRREQLLAAAVRILDEPDEREGSHNLRSRATKENKMETEGQDESPVLNPADSRADTAAEAATGDATAPPPPPPLPLTDPPQQIAAMPVLQPSNIVPTVNKIDITIVKPTVSVNPSGAGTSSSGKVKNPCGKAYSGFRPNPSGERKLSGQNEAVNGAYLAVSSLRQSTRTNPSLGVGSGSGGGAVHENSHIGSFANKDDNRSEICHFRTRLDRKQNVCFSFDPKTLECSNCPNRGGHSVGEGGGGEANLCFE